MTTTSTTALRPGLRTLLMLAALSVFAVACGGNGGYRPFQQSYEEETSLVFGYLDLSGAPTDLRWVTMKKVRPETSTPYYPMFVEKGLFFRTHVPEGLYKFVQFGGHSFRMGNMTYSFAQQGKQAMDPVVNKPGLYYVGSYKYEQVDPWPMTQRFRIARTARPTEAELLQQLLDKAEHPAWKDKIQQRLKEIGK